METLLISACLLGVRCRYDGGGKEIPELQRLKARYQLVPVCPEIMGGLPTPRPPAEIKAGRVMNREGADVTLRFRRGAEEALRLAQLFDCKWALLKERSPSCGVGMVYDGSFGGGLCPGDGVCAALLKQNGVTVLGESQLSSLLMNNTDA